MARTPTSAPSCWPTSPICRAFSRWATTPGRKPARPASRFWVSGHNGLSKVVGQATEASNVDMSKELVNMIIAQRTYQANSQTIKTQNEIMQVLMNIK